MPGTTRHDLPSGGWIEMRDHNFLRAKDRRALLQQINADPELSNMDRGFAAMQMVAALLITQWQLPYEPDRAPDGTARGWTLPSNDRSLLDELLLEDDTVLQELIDPASRILLPRKPSPDQVDDPESPSGPESA